MERSNRNRRVRLTLLVPLLALAGTAGRAAADEARITVRPIEGPTGDRATGVALQAVGGMFFTLVPASDWDSVAARRSLGSTSTAPDDLAAVARELRLQVVVTGAVRQVRKRAWELVVNVHQGPTGKALATLRYPLRGPKLTPPILRRLRADLVPAINDVAVTPVEGVPLAASPPAPAADGGASPQASPQQSSVAVVPRASSEEIARLDPDQRERARAKPATGRPEWADYLQASVGATVSARNFRFEQASAPGYRNPGAPGVTVDATLFPLAFLAARGAGAAAASQLGVGFVYGASFPPAAVPCYAADTSGTCAPTADRYGASEYRFEVALRWHWNVVRRLDRPELHLEVGYGQHAFAIQKRWYLNESPHDVGPPDVAYSYVEVGLGTLIPLYTRKADAMKRLALYLEAHVHLPFKAGPIRAVDEWGAGSQWGVRGEAGLELRLWRGLFARLGGHVEDYQLSFAQPAQSTRTRPPCPCGTTGGASDLFYGGTLSLGLAL